MIGAGPLSAAAQFRLGQWGASSSNVVGQGAGAPIPPAQAAGDTGSVSRINPQHPYFWVAGFAALGLACLAYATERPLARARVGASVGPAEGSVEASI